MKEDDDNAAKPGEPSESRQKFFWYTLPEKRNICFWILPSIDNVTSSCLSSRQQYFESVDVEMYDVFLLFISASCDDHEPLLLISNEIKNRKKPVFFVQILQGVLGRETPQQEIGSKAYHIDVHQPGECDFYTLLKSIAEVLAPAKKKSFNQIPKIGELFAVDRFKDFVKGTTCMIYSFKLLCYIMGGMLNIS